MFKEVDLWAIINDKSKNTDELVHEVVNKTGMSKQEAITKIRKLITNKLLSEKGASNV